MERKDYYSWILIISLNLFILCCPAIIIVTVKKYNLYPACWAIFHFIVINQFYKTSKNGFIKSMCSESGDYKINPKDVFYYMILELFVCIFFSAFTYQAGYNIVLCSFIVLFLSASVGCFSGYREYYKMSQNERVLCYLDKRKRIKPI